MTPVSIYTLKKYPFEIIPLQTTRKEYNWKTEEAVAWAAVTLESEWIKVSILNVYDDEKVYSEE